MKDWDLLQHVASGDVTNGDDSGAKRLGRLLAEHAADVQAALAEHARLVAGAGAAAERPVLTHDEPHPGHLLRTSSRLVLVDLETARPATPERDLWLAGARTEGVAAQAYTRTNGQQLDRGLMAARALAWTLAEVAAVVSSLRTATSGDDDTDWQRTSLVEALNSLTPLPA